MRRILRTKHLLLFAAIVLMVPLLAACAGGDDEDDADTETEATPTAVTEDTDSDTESTPEGGLPEVDTEGTADVEITPDIDMTVETGTEGTETPDAMGDEETPDTDSTPDGTAEATGTANGTPDAASTPDGTGTPGMGATDGPLDDLTELTTEVPNFTVDYSGTFENVPDDTGEYFSSDMEMMLEQSEPDVYHLSFMITGDDAVEIEIWSLDDASYVSESGGEPLELPAGTATDVVPVEGLLLAPPDEVLDTAEEVGQEDINGRSTTHYTVDAEDAALILMSQNTNISNPEGEMDIWVDEELDVVIQTTADITFENEDGSEGSIVTELMVTDIGETDDIEAPTS